MAIAVRLRTWRIADNVEAVAAAAREDSGFHRGPWHPHRIHTSSRHARGMKILRRSILCVLAFPPLALAQGKAPIGVDPTTRAAVVAAVGEQLRQGYVKPELGARLAARLEERLAAGAYDGCGLAKELVERLNRDLLAGSEDRHLRLVHRPGRPVRGPVIEIDGGPAVARGDGRPGARRGGQPVIVVERAAPGRARPGGRSADAGPVRVVGPGGGDAAGRATNFEFRKVEVLDGNVGYLDLREFVPHPGARETAAAAMRFLRHTDAIIIDLRRNSGGGGELVRYLSSYFFGSQPVLLNTFYNRLDDATRERWTEAVDGAKRPDVPLYLLTSRYTFSAAEDFAYSLKHLGRAKVIGERTGGGAHPSIDRQLPADFVLLLPIARAIHPVTKGNWEGVGVAPDVEVPAEQALGRALELARSDRAPK